MINMRLCKAAMAGILAVSCHQQMKAEKPSCETIYRNEPALTRELKCSPDKWAVAQKAVNMKAFPELRKALFDEDPAVRKVAAYSLGMTGDLSVVDDLGRALDDRESGWFAAKSIISIAARNTDNQEVMVSVGLLNRILGDKENTEKTCSVIEKIAAKHPKDSRLTVVVPQLTEVLKAGNLSAVRPLAVIRDGNESALTKIVKENPDLRKRELLESLNDGSMAVTLRELLGLEGAEFVAIRGAAINSVRRIAQKDPDDRRIELTIPALIGIVTHPETNENRKKSIIALGTVGAVDAVGVLSGMVELPDPHRYWAANALGQIAEKNPDGNYAVVALPALSRMLQSENQDERMIASEVIATVERVRKNNERASEEGWPSTRGPRVHYKHEKDEWPSTR